MGGTSSSRAHDATIFQIAGCFLFLLGSIGLGQDRHVAREGVTAEGGVSAQDEAEALIALKAALKEGEDIDAVVIRRFGYTRLHAEATNTWLHTSLRMGLTLT